MARPRKISAPDNAGFPAPAALMTWAESLGEALGRGVARGINVGMASVPPVGAPAVGSRRGRPPKALAGGAVPSDRRCSVGGCMREARSKGLCSAHYQAERRRKLQAKS